MHFPGSHLRLTLSTILPYEARTFLTVIPFGNIPRSRLAKFWCIIPCEYLFVKKKEAFVRRRIMAEFLSYYLQLLLILVLPVLAFGVAVYFCNRIFFSLVGEGRGASVAIFLHVVTTPLREFAHLVACVLCFHRVHEFRLLNLYAPDGEIGFVEHSYHRKNPVAVLGNFVFAIAPAALGLFLTFLVVLTCFGGSFDGFSADLRALGDMHAGASQYVSLSVQFFLSLFAGNGLVGKIIGALLMMVLCLGVYVSLTELFDAVSGIFMFSLFLLAFAGITALACDERTRRLILSGARSFGATVGALYLVVLAFCLLMLLVGFVIFVWRSFLVSEAPTGEIVPVEQARMDDWT